MFFYILFIKKYKNFEKGKQTADFLKFAHNCTKVIEMKKTNKALSVLLAALMLFTCIPYTVTASGEVTSPVDAQNEWTRDSNSLGRINSYVKNTDYYFVQTEENQQFEFTPRFFIQKTSGLRYVYVRSFDLYSGASNEGEGRINEYPVIKNNPTSDFINTYGATFNWSAAPSSDSEVGNAASNASGVFNDFVNHNNFTLKGTIGDLSGCPRYYFDCKVNFTGNGSEVKGIETGYYWSLKWTYADDSVSASETEREVRVAVNVHVTDKRNLIDLVNTINNQIQDASVSEKLKKNLTDALAELPENILSEDVFFEQDVIDHYYEQLSAVAEDLADYTDYNTAYRRAQYLYNDNKGGTHYTEESLEAFWAQVTYIDSNLSRKLGNNDEGNEKVAQAVQQINNAYQILVAKNSSADGSTSYKLYGNTTCKNPDALFHDYSYNPYDNYGNTGYGNNFVSIFLEDTSFKFMQLTDGENLSFNQSIAMFRNIKQSDDVSKFLSMTFDTGTSCSDDKHRYYIPEITQNNTQHFIDRLDESVYTTGDNKVHSWVADTNYDTAALLAAYPITDSYGTDYAISTSLVNGDGTLAEKCLIGKKGNSGSYYVYPAISNVVFNANDDDTSSRGAYSESYVYKIRWEYRSTALADYTLSDVHVQTTIDVTDCRSLVEDYYDAEYIYDNAAESGLYTQSSLKALADAIDDASEAVSGTVYKSQETVNAQEKAIEDAVEGLEFIADYEAYYEAYEQATAIINKGNGTRSYKHSDFEEFTETIASINNNLDKDLNKTAENQTTIDNATQAILDAIETLNSHPLCNYENLEAVIEMAENIIAEQTENPDTYTSSSIEALAEELEKAIAVNETELESDKDGVNQKTIEDETIALYEKITAVEKKADYSDFNSAVEQAEDIINNHADEYPPEIIEELEKVIDKYNNEENTDTYLDKDLSAITENQKTVDNAAADIASALENAANNKICDYSALEAAIEAAQKIDTTDKTTSSAKLLEECLKEALEIAAIDPPLTVADPNNQKTIDDAAQALIDAVNNIKNKASAPDIDGKIEEILDKVNNDDDDLGTGDRYDTDVEDEVKDKIKEIQDTLDDLSEDDPALEEKLDEIEGKLSELEEYLDNNTYYFFDFLDSDNTTVLAENVRIKTGEPLASVAPEVSDYDNFEFDSWANEAGEVVTDATADMSVHALMAEKQIVAKETSEIVFDDEKNTVYGIEAGKTVDEVKALLENNADLIKVYNYNDELLDGTDKVGTGSYIVLVSPSDSTVVKDTWQYIIIKGDVDGNGIINGNDYDISMSATFGEETYPVNENNAQTVKDNFFKANDIDDDGVIDVVDTFQIMRMKTK